MLAKDDEIVVCIKLHTIVGRVGEFTIHKQYRNIVTMAIDENDGLYGLCDDYQRFSYYNSENFVSLSDYRESIIDNILE